MAVNVDIVLHENNDETVAFTITAEDPAEDLTTITSLEMIFKQLACTDDDDEHSLILTSADPGEIDILTQAIDEITAEAFVPGTYLMDPWTRFYRVDALNASGNRKTAIYGDAKVVNL